MRKIKAAIIGATGYTGSELVRLLLAHPHVSIEVITSETKKGMRFSDIHTQFRGIFDIELDSIANIEQYNPDVVFLALPHGVSMEFIRDHQNPPYKIIDLSADFRLQSVENYQEWYKQDHLLPEQLDKWVYGSPELYHQDISKAQFVANPGCYVTSVILALAPLLNEKLIDTQRIIADSKSGVTGAGVKPKEVTHFPNVYDDFKPYGLKTHRHTIEIQEIADRLSYEKGRLLFTPHLLPIDRGIISLVYSYPVRQVNQDDLHQIYTNYYQNAPFVRITKQIPATKEVRGSNYCDINIQYDERTDTIFTISALDNLVKGASGQAIQNMNIMFGFDENEGLQQIALKP